ncbi:MAG TPA: hypothetical protein VMW51_11275, partial [Terriglobia bacterium]|nr:hypothetical protein [Terriglobia bacterium]
MAARLLELPLSFVPNAGQIAGDAQQQVHFFSAGRGYSLFLTSSQAVLTLRKSAGPGERNRVSGHAMAEGGPARPAVLRMKFEGANAQASVRGMDVLPGKANY